MWRESWLPIAVCRSIRAREHHQVTVGIAEPEFPMVRTPVTLGRIAMSRHDDLRLQRPGTLDQVLRSALEDRVKQVFARCECLEQAVKVARQKQILARL